MISIVRYKVGDTIEFGCAKHEEDQDRGSGVIEVKSFKGVHASAGDEHAAAPSEGEASPSDDNEPSSESD